MEDRHRMRFWHAENKIMVYIGPAIEDLAWDLDRGIDSEWVRMDCTGLKDKNGKLIYEGDIIKYENEGHREITPIKYEQELKQAVYGHGDYGIDNRSGFTISGWYGDVKKIEIIGNIYEHEHLLKQ